MNDESPISFRILGFPIGMGFSFLFFMAFLGWVSRFDGSEILIWVALGTVAILLHELGHALVMRRFGLESTIRFWMLGGLAIPNDQEAAGKLSNGRWILVGLAGPGVGLVLGAIGLLVLVLLEPQGALRFTLVIWIFVNLGWGLFNLLPIAALDGGQILQHVTLGLFGNKARTLAALVGIAGSVAVALAAWVAGFGYVALIALIFGVANPDQYQALREALSPSRKLGSQEECAGC